MRLKKKAPQSKTLSGHVLKAVKRVCLRRSIELDIEISDSKLLARLNGLFRKTHVVSN